MASFVERGVSQTQYCAAAGVSAGTFSLWRRQARVSREGRTEVAGAQPFAQVYVTDPARDQRAPGAEVAPTVAIHLSGEVKIVAAIGTDPTWLVSLLKIWAGA